MEFAITKNGWINIETDEIIPFGDLAVDVYNVTRKDKKFVDKIICQALKVKTFASCISGRDTPECPREKKIFESDKEIIAIIWSKSKILDSSNLQYIFDGKNKYYSGTAVYYVPLYKNYLLDWFNDNKYYIEFLKAYNQNEKFLNLIEFLCNYEDRPFYTDEEFYNITLRILESWIYPLEINTTIRRYKNLYCRTFIVGDPHWLMYDDILQMINFDYNLEFCPICGTAFVKRDKRKNFCDNCAKDEKAKKRYNDQKRKSSPQYLHKIITDMLRNRGEDYTEFVRESAYYADIVAGKNVVNNPQYSQTIRTELDYQKWLDSKHKEFMKRKR